jgi:hypothetical protein
MRVKAWRSRAFAFPGGDGTVAPRTREDGVHLVGREPERAKAGLHRENAVVGVALGRAAQNLEHGDDRRRAKTRCPRRAGCDVWKPTL